MELPVLVPDFEVGRLANPLCNNAVSKFETENRLALGVILLIVGRTIGLAASSVLNPVDDGGLTLIVLASNRCHSGLWKFKVKTINSLDILHSEAPNLHYLLTVHIVPCLSLLVFTCWNDRYCIISCGQL